MNLVSNWATRQRNNTLTSFGESDDESGTDSSFSSSEEDDSEGEADWQLDTSEQVEMFKRCVRLPEFLLTH